MPATTETERVPALVIERTSDRWVSIVLSVLLHGTLIAVLAYGFWQYRQSRPPTPTLAIEATVVDSRSVNAPGVNTPPQPAQPPEPQPQPQTPPQAQPPPAPAESEPVEPTGPPEPTPEELAQREQAQKEEADKERAQQEQAQREAAEKQRLEEQKQQEEATQKQAEEKAEADRKAAEAKKQAEAKRLAEQKRAEDAQRQADEKARAESEADLRNDLAAEEHANQLAASGAVSSWEAQISARIHRAWIQPPSARPGIQCELIVTQARGGAVQNARIGSCNGDQAVRESIVAAAYRASPLPAPPDPSLFLPEVEVTFKPQ
jgi:colicin import membrane protein